MSHDELFGFEKERQIMKRKWQHIVASVVALAGAFFGGVWGSLLAAFAGDGWWTSDVALKTYQFSITLGWTCWGAVPGAVWLLCLRQKWVLPLLLAAGCALLIPVFESIPIRNESRGLFYAGGIASGFVVGLILWICVRRSPKR
jgi:hypothetical protein